MYIQEVAKLTGVSVRTLHYYDEIGLLEPIKDPTSSYRIYTTDHLDTLQQILFYKQLNYSLKDIKEIITNPNFDALESLKKQRDLMQSKIQHLRAIYHLINKTIEMKEGNYQMSNNEKFEQFKQQMIEENEVNYGEEIREKHGEQSVMEMYGKIKEMSEEQYEAAKQLEQQLINRLQEASEEASEELLMEIAELHKRWLSFYWAKYTKEAHLGLSQIYMFDERFQHYYNDRAGEGAVNILMEAIRIYTK